MTFDMGQLSSNSNNQYLNEVNIAKHDGGCLARFLSTFFALFLPFLIEETPKIGKREDLKNINSSTLLQFPLKISLKLMRMDKREKRTIFKWPGCLSALLARLGGLEAAQVVAPVRQLFVNATSWET